MRGHNEQLYEIIEPVVVGLGYELVGVQYFPSRERGLLRIYIDHPSGIGVDDCEQVSHQISGTLDVGNPIPNQYNLEVSSPGLDRPLFRPNHFEQFIGHRIRIKLDTSWGGRKNITGQLLGYQSNNVLIEENGIERAIPLNLIGVARLVPER
jgi:ribosome maturation factor RimP